MYAAHAAAPASKAKAGVSRAWEHLQAQAPEGVGAGCRHSQGYQAGEQQAAALQNLGPCYRQMVSDVQLQALQIKLTCSSSMPNAQMPRSSHIAQTSEVSPQPYNMLMQAVCRARLQPPLHFLMTTSPNSPVPHVSVIAVLFLFGLVTCAYLCFLEGGRVDGNKSAAHGCKGAVSGRLVSALLQKGWSRSIELRHIWREVQVPGHLSSCCAQLEPAAKAKLLQCILGHGTVMRGDITGTPAEALDTWLSL